MIQGQSAQIAPGTLFSGLALDSRQVKPGDLFFCLKGEATNGHLYAAQAIAQGTGALIANPRVAQSLQWSTEWPTIWVEDPNKALRDLGKDYRKQFRGQVIGITGSNGKTSTKELTAGLCRALGKTHATSGNYNNFIGVPLTLLTADQEEAWWVIEMGTNHFGEIATLSQIAQPHWGILTNIGESHLEFLYSTEGVAREKSGLFQGMQPGATVAIPVTLKHQDIVEHFATERQIRLVTYGFQETREGLDCDFPGELLVSTPEQSRFLWEGAEFEVRFGNPMLLTNLLGALTVLHLAGTPLSALQHAANTLIPLVKGRMQFKEMGQYLLVDDTYNANPTSFLAGIQSLRQLYPQRRLLVVAGEMAELGENSQELHSILGEEMVRQGVSRLLALGTSDAEACVDGWQSVDHKKHAFVSSELIPLVQCFREWVLPGDIVLVKGSRSSRMELFIEALSAHQ